MLTKNSAKPYFSKCLLSVKENVPVNKLIVVDAYSTDNTVEIIKKFFPTSVIIRSKQPLAEARKLGISYVSTEWFAFIDSDIQLFTNWFDLLSGLIDKDVGSIQGQDQYANDHLIKYSYWQQNIWKKKFLHKCDSALSVVDIKSFRTVKIRGLTHNTLIRTDCVKDWNPPSGLHIGEDHHLFLHILKKEYKWLVLNKPLCLHYAFLNFNEVFNRGLLESRELRKIANFGYMSRDDLWIDYTAVNYLKLFFLASFKSLLASLYEIDPKIFMYSICLYGAMVLGYFL